MENSRLDRTNENSNVGKANFPFQKCLKPSLVLGLCFWGIGFSVDASCFEQLNARTNREPYGDVAKDRELIGLLGTDEERRG